MHPVTNIQHRQSNPIVSFLEKGTFGESGAKIEEAATASWFHSLWVWEGLTPTWGAQETLLASTTSCQHITELGLEDFSRCCHSTASTARIPPNIPEQSCLWSTFSSHPSGKKASASRYLTRHSAPDLKPKLSSLRPHLAPRAWMIYKTVPRPQYYSVCWTQPTHWAKAIYSGQPPWPDRTQTKWGLCYKKKKKKNSWSSIRKTWT